MFEKVLSKDAKRSLAILGESGLLKDAYLAGGTALALQIGHRISVDFDFFTPKEFNTTTLVQRIKKIIPDFKLEKAEWGTVLGYIKRTRFSLFFYSYPLLFKTSKFLKIKIADVKDIAAMKIAAIADRGTKRDFIDIYFITEKEKILSLEECLRLYDKKFKLLKQNRLHILKSLVYFDEAEVSEMPLMLKEVSWKEVKEKIKNSVLKIKI